MVLDITTNMAAQRSVHKRTDALLRHRLTEGYHHGLMHHDSPSQTDSGLENENRTSDGAMENYDLDEIAPIAPIPLLDGSIDNGDSLERTRQREIELKEEETRIPDKPSPTTDRARSLMTKLYTHSYLILFSIMGTLAREGMAALLVYPGAPVILPTLWVNFAGCLVMGFLAEDRMLFRHEWGPDTSGTASDAHTESEDTDLEAAKSHLNVKKTLPLYIGLSVGFCGSFTTFSTFVLDSFLALCNGLETPSAPTSDRNKAYSFCALTAVVLLTVHVSLGGLFLGAHLAIFTRDIIPSLPYFFMRKFLDPVATILGWGCWIGAIILRIYPPYDDWRGSVLFSLAFAPLGVFTRFYLAVFLNGKLPTFPLGTFAANVLGTLILAVVWDVSQILSRPLVGLQLLEGVKNGYCAVVTTVSTLALELSSLQREHAYRYGTVSFLVSFGLMVIISGSFKWTR
ncbi:chromosome condensation [Fusarium pseudocircinatum]|uniref:Chromosome condensation n=1 Tax=Fusarium pseudocircinatum TaxID=56676 RepID=A0A8H5KX97_9HYPO|nr:chromosome condensation [Fusarium pseudocircinatum]